MIRTLVLGIAILAIGGCTLRTSHSVTADYPAGGYDSGPYRQGPAMGAPIRELPMTEAPPTPTSRPVAAPLPPPPEAVLPPAPTVVKYKIKEGDILGNISMHFYGTSKKWQLISDHNHLNPKKLKVGQVIEIPEPTQNAN